MDGLIDEIVSEIDALWRHPGRQIQFSFLVTFIKHLSICAQHFVSIKLKSDEKAGKVLIKSVSESVYRANKLICCG